MKLLELFELFFEIGPFLLEPIPRLLDLVFEGCLLALKLSLVVELLFGLLELCGEGLVLASEGFHSL
jgi:hypothetical protein